MKKFLTVIEETGTGHSAYCPVLPACVSTGHTRDEVERNMRKAIELHLEGMRLKGMEVPDPHTYSDYFEILA
jgi:predicted RNase H-like HicB family nuclease